MTDEPILPDAEDAPEVEPAPEPDSHDDGNDDATFVTSASNSPSVTL